MTDWWPTCNFERPEWLWGAALLPLLFFWFRRSLVDLPRRQIVASLAVRSVILLLLLLCLAGLQWITWTDRVYVVFAVDESLSIGDEGGDAAGDFLEAATTDADASAFSVLRFAMEPDRSRPSASSNVRQPSAGNEGRDPQWRLGTNLEAAIDVAVAGVPSGFVPHVVLLTDGNETVGDVMSVDAVSGVRVSAVALATRSADEIQVSAVNVPAQVAEEAPFMVEVVVDANHDDQVMVEIFRDDYRVLSEEKPIVAGPNTFRFSQQIDRPAEFTATISRPAELVDNPLIFRDSLLDNNTASGLVFTAGKPRVLLIERVPELAQPLEWALQEEGIQVDIRPPAAVPETLAGLQDYQVLMLSNVPADELSIKQMEVIRSYVRDVGGGFIMLGGDQSFGLGGYYKTAVEAVLPVRCDFQKEKEKPGIAMVLVMDKSGSMGGQKLELAKDAARGAVELLGDKDQIGVIAFDGKPYWVSNIVSASQKSVVSDRISAVELGGGTALYPAMQEAFRALQATTAKLKHVIVLTDGYSTPGDFEGLTQDMAALQITVSTVGLGEVDQALLERIAEIGNGRSYFCTDASSVPQIFAKETVAASKSAIREEPFLPLLARSSPALNGIDFDDAPFLLGYVVTQPKATSEVLLVEPEKRDPILAWWRYGLGMSVAFTSDAKARWAADWLSWDGYNVFWAQLVRHCMKPMDSDGLQVQLQRKGNRTHVVVETVDAEGRFLNEAMTMLTVVGPQRDPQTITMPQTAPGRYEGTIDTDQAGAWNLQIRQALAGETLHQQTRSLVVGYNDELRIRQPDLELLRTLAERSGGEFDPAPTTVFDPSRQHQVTTTTPLWPRLLLFAMLLFVVDVGLRRLDLSRWFGTDRLNRNLVPDP